MQVDLHLMEKEIVFGTQNHQFLNTAHLFSILDKFPQYNQLNSPQLHLVLQDLILTDSETVLPHQFLYFVVQGMSAMDMEIAFKILQVLLLLKFVQLDNTVMVMEIAFQIQYQFPVKVDGKVMEKEDVFH